MLSYKELRLNYLLKQKKLLSKILQDILLYIYQSFITEVSLPQIIKTKKNTKTVFSSKVVVQYVNRKILQFYKKNSINYYHMTFFQVLSNFLTIFKNPYFFLTFLTLWQPWIYLIWLMVSMRLKNLNFNKKCARK